MKGYIITYKPKDSASRTLFNHTLYGCLRYKKSRGRDIAYYTPGLLDGVGFKRLIDSKVFITGTTLHNKDMFIDVLSDLGSVSIESAIRDDISVVLGSKHWEDIASERGCIIKRNSKNG